MDNSCKCCNIKQEDRTNLQVLHVVTSNKKIGKTNKYCML